MKKKATPIVIYLLLTLLPLSLGLIYAFLYSIGAIGALSSGLTLAHWRMVFEEGVFLQSLCLSASIALLALLISVTIALFFCLNYKSQHSEKKQTIPFVWYLPLGIPPMIAAFLGFQFLGNTGVLSRLFFQLGFLQSSDEFRPIINDYFYLGTLITFVLMTFPYFLLLFFTTYEQEQLATYTALSSTLGATKSQIQRYVIIPILLQKARATIVLWAIFLASAYEIPLLLGRQSPSMVSVLIGQKFKKFNIEEMPQAYAITVLYAALIIAMTLWSREKEKI